MLSERTINAWELRPGCMLKQKSLDSFNYFKVEAVIFRGDNIFAECKRLADEGSWYTDPLPEQVIIAFDIAESKEFRW